ncbi:hypothetical protein ACHAWF_016865 [Thalassiosira exigua]
MALKTKVGVALVALMASSSSVATDGGIRRGRRVRKHKLRDGGRRGGGNRRLATGHNRNEDITEDVAFWTRMLKEGSIAPNPPDPVPMPTNPPDIATPNPTDPIATPNPTDPFATPNPTNPPVPVSTPNPTNPPVPAPTPSNVPVANDDFVSMPADDLAFISVLENDIPAPGQELGVKQITVPASNGDCGISLEITEVTYAPNPGFTGTDSCVYEACDSTPLCDTATVTITVT